MVTGLLGCCIYPCWENPLKWIQKRENKNLGEGKKGNGDSFVFFSVLEGKITSVELNAKNVKWRKHDLDRRRKAVQNSLWAAGGCFAVPRCSVTAQVTSSALHWSTQCSFDPLCYFAVVKFNRGWSTELGLVTASVTLTKIHISVTVVTYPLKCLFPSSLNSEHYSNMCIWELGNEPFWSGTNRSALG